MLGYQRTLLALSIVNSFYVCTFFLVLLVSRFTVSYTLRMVTYWNLAKDVLAVLQVLVNVGFLMGSSKMMGFVMMGNKWKMKAAMW